MCVCVCDDVSLVSVFLVHTKNYYHLYTLLCSMNATKGTKNDTITMQNDSNHDLLKKIKNFINIMMNTKNI